MQRITPCLWFNGNGEEAAKFYTSVFTSVFKNAKITQTNYYPETGQEEHGQKPGSVMTVHFDLDGCDFMILNGGPQFKFSEAISLMVNCDTQAEIDQLWDKLTSDGGQEVQCGWLKDKYGVSWQIVPTIWKDLMNDPARFERYMAAMMKMVKLDIETLKNA